MFFIYNTLTLTILHYITPRSGWWRSHMAGIYSDCSTRKIIMILLVIVIRSFVYLLLLLYKRYNTLLVGRQEGHLACKNWVGAGVVVCLERGADLHMVQLMPLPLTVSCFSEIQIGFIFLVPAYPGSPGIRAVKRVCVCNTYTNNNAGCLQLLEISWNLKYCSWKNLEISLEFSSYFWKIL